MIRLFASRLALASLLFSAIPASAQPRSGASTQRQLATGSAAHSAWAARMARYYAAWSPGRRTFDIKAAAPFYKPTSDLFAYESQAGVDSLPATGVVGWSAYRDAYTGVMTNFSEFQVLPNKDLRVWRRGDIAWTANTFRTKGQVKGGPAIAGAARATLIWERVGANDWRIVHEHISPLPGS